MSLSHGYLIVSGTEIAVFGYTKQNVVTSDLYGLCMPRTSMAAHLPYLPGSPPVSHRVPTSFVPPAHNQGVSLAHLQGLAPW